MGAVDRLTGRPVGVRSLLLVAVAALLLLLTAGGKGGATASSPAPAGDPALARAFERHASGVEVLGSGTVVRLLAEDLEGDRHQRFILELASGQTVLIAHNIDVAPRLDGVEVGDGVAFRGVYEWNEQGGVVHWTHHDSSGEHLSGWLRSGGRTVQ